MGVQDMALKLYPVLRVILYQFHEIMDKIIKIRWEKKDKMKQNLKLKLVNINQDI